jgi:dTDP-4-dehydrorhamnose 3,5-epimerase
MRFEPTAVDGVVAIELEPLEDERGVFARAWCRREFEEHGLHAEFVQENLGYSVIAGTIRGQHFQRPPFEEVKLVRCTAGSIWDVAADLRPTSPTHLRWVGIELTAKRRNMLYVPAGCAHGYLTLTDGAEVRYLTSQEYAPEAVGGVRYDDEALGIGWPRTVTLVSDQDRSWPALVTEKGGVSA